MGDIVHWPWPRIFTTEYHTFLVTRQSNTNLHLSEIYLDRTVTPSEWLFFPVQDLGSETLVQEISFADFGPFYVVATLSSTGIRQTFVRDLSRPRSFNCMNSFDEPQFGTVCAFNSNFLGGNISCLHEDTPWRDLVSSSFAWSGIGNFSLHPGEDITAGFRTLGFPHSHGESSVIYALLPFKDRILAYGNGGCIALNPGNVGSSFTYGSASVQILGIRSRNHIAGDDALHGFVDLSGDFWTIESGGKLERRGYREFISPMLEDDDNITIVSYLPHEKKFCVSNGQSSLLINTYGASTNFQYLSSFIYGPDGEVYGTSIDSLDLYAQVVTDILDFSSRGDKTVESFLANLEHPSSARAYFSVDWRMNKSAPFRRRPLVYGGPSGEAGIHVTANEFRLVLRVTNYEDVFVHEFLANIKFGDQRFKRGTVPAQYSA